MTTLLTHPALSLPSAPSLISALTTDDIDSLDAVSPLAALFAGQTSRTERRERGDGPAKNVANTPTTPASPTLSPTLGIQIGPARRPRLTPTPVEVRTGDRADDTPDVSEETCRRRERQARIDAASPHAAAMLDLLRALGLSVKALGVLDDLDPSACPEELLEGGGTPEDHIWPRTLIGIRWAVEKAWVEVQSLIASLAGYVAREMAEDAGDPVDMQPGLKM